MHGHGRDRGYVRHHAHAHAESHAHRQRVRAPACDRALPVPDDQSWAPALPVIEQSACNTYRQARPPSPLTLDNTAIVLIPLLAVR